MPTAQEHLRFLNDVAADPLRSDPERVQACLVHRLVDVRLAAVKRMLQSPTHGRITAIIEAMATHPSWKRQGLYAAAKRIGPHFGKHFGQFLADHFLALSERDHTAFCVLCNHCASSILRGSLEQHLFHSDDCKIALRALTAINCIRELDHTAILQRSTNHRCQEVAELARGYLGPPAKRKL